MNLKDKKSRRARFDFYFYLVTFLRTSHTRILARRCGFSLMEVLFTLTLIALVVTPLMMQQSSILRNVHRMSRRTEYIYAAQNFLYEVRKQLEPYVTNYTLEKRHEATDAVLRFTRKAAAQKSKLASQKRIYIDRVTITWDEEGVKRKDDLVTFVYVPPWPEEQKK